MRLEFQILLAVALDFALGDPHGWPHPVRAIGALAARIETPLRRTFRSARVAGTVAVLVVVGGTGVAAWTALALVYWMHPFLADLAGVVLLYTCLAARDLARHGGSVHDALRQGRLEEARRRVSMIVGRDTKSLDRAGISRAAVESVAENTVDGVTAPLFFAVLFGPVGAITYKAVNTLDSMFGYRNERYLQFGWASARLDDLVNWLPARLTAPLVVAAAWVLRSRPGDAWRILVRDHRNTPSPNAGLTEAAMAGALGVQLGGPSAYGGKLVEKPTMGDATQAIQENHIRQANWLMAVTTALMLLVLLTARFAVGRLLLNGDVS